jgi:signal peptidase
VSGRRRLRRPVSDHPFARLLGQSVSAAALLLVLALALIVVVVPRVTGAIPLTVLTSSMEPGLPPGTLIIVQPVDDADLAINDVITYQMQSGRPGVITHRIIGISLAADGERTYVLQGDNNSSPDAAPVIADQVQGRLWYSVPLLGYVNTLVTSEVKAWVAPVGAVLLFGYCAFMLAGALADARRKRAEKRVAPPLA